MVEVPQLPVTVEEEAVHPWQLLANQLATYFSNAVSPEILTQIFSTQPLFCPHSSLPLHVFISVSLKGTWTLLLWHL